MSDPLLKPPVSLLCKLGSIAVHVAELHSPDGHAYDRAALDQLLNDAEVTAWVDEMGKAGFLPVKRRKF
jgi:hypothetical protein